MNAISSESARSPGIIDYFDGGRVGVIEAHEDDAAILMSGLIGHLAVIDAREVHGITVTDGRWTTKRRGLSGRSIVQSRIQESIGSWRHMGVDSLHQHSLGYEDGTLAERATMLRLIRHIAELALRHELDTLITLGEEDQHPDHVASHLAAVAASHIVGGERERPLRVLGLTKTAGDFVVPISLSQKSSSGQLAPQPI